MANEGLCSALRVIWLRFRTLSNRLVSQSPVSVTNPVVCRERLRFALRTPGRRFKVYAENISENVQNVYCLFTKQCNVIVGLRIWRAFQIVALYRQLYGERRLLQTIGSNVLRNCKSRSLYMLLSAAGIFHWERDGVSDREIESVSDEMVEIGKLIDNASMTGSQETPVHDGWEVVIKRSQLIVWRRHMGQHNLYEYKVYGTFNDISATAFYTTQLDLDFWSGWDRQTMAIHIIDQDQTSNSSVIHWVYKYPYPMYPRDYVFVRRHKVCQKSKKMVIYAKAVDHPRCPELGSYVRIQQYQSKMVIEPHTTFDENGFDYCLTYFDDPQTHFPSLCYNWLASTGVPDFVERLHCATVEMQRRMQRGYHPNVQTGSRSEQHNGSIRPAVENYC
ncbi:stAR-related lipid transfer protein 7, mitochondrial-like [Pomacea canaliculata]|nr:stAR-related lipid transfer protein 7, mitochondrial-like [Pomacea canaliculata]